MRRKYFSSVLFAAAFSGSLWAAPAQVTVSGRRLLVNGQAYSVQGVAYSPVPTESTVGASGGLCTGGYQWWTDRAVYVADFPLIKRMGANTIRAYGILNDTSATSVVKVRAMLDEAQARGLYVILNYYPLHTVDPSVPATQAAWQSEFVAAVNAYKDHPAVLIWEFANENNIDNGQYIGWYPMVDQIAAAAKVADPNHPIMTVEGETSSVHFTVGSVARSANDPNMTHLDIWGVNAYRGTSFQTLFEDLASSTTKPILLTEFGKDAYRDSTGQEDQAMQASYISSQWPEIASRLSASNATKPLAGAVVFEWTDEWWKDLGGQSCQVHNTAVQFTRSTDSVDPNYNDEWFGLAAISQTNAITNPAGTARTLRSAYNTLQGFWNPQAAASTAGMASLFDGPVRNYPNPFRIGAGNTKFVALLNAPGKVDVMIYDAGGQFVASLTQASTGAGRVELLWDGRNSQGAFVSPGLYFVRVEGSGSGLEEKQFRRVVAVK